MKAHEHLSEMTTVDVSRFRGNFIKELKEQSRGSDGAARVAEGRLTVLDPASVEYALALTALVTEENEAMRSNFAHLMRFISEIRPPGTKGRMSAANVPDRFRGEWPHQRLGHKTWTAFVESPVHGELDSSTRQYSKPPGLGWTKQYESSLFKGYSFVRDLVAKALPDASEEEQQQRVDEAAQGAGAKALMTLGEGKEVNTGINFPTTDSAAQAVESLASGEVTADDLRTRGAEALTHPKPKGERRTRVDRLAEDIEALPAEMIAALWERVRGRFINLLGATQ